MYAAQLAIELHVHTHLCELRCAHACALPHTACTTQLPSPPSSQTAKLHRLGTADLDEESLGAEQYTITLMLCCLKLVISILTVEEKG